MHSGPSDSTRFDSVLLLTTSSSYVLARTLIPLARPSQERVVTRPSPRHDDISRLRRLRQNRANVRLLFWWRAKSSRRPDRARRRTRGRKSTAGDRERNSVERIAPSGVPRHFRRRRDPRKKGGKKIEKAVSSRPGCARHDTNERPRKRSSASRDC